MSLVESVVIIVLAIAIVAAILALLGHDGNCCRVCARFTGAEFEECVAGCVAGLAAD